ncbi:MAG: histidine phosphatase family protein [Paracoccaceae bacterium]|nr:histidine phosphatase family protein [Paracoccaceae bacterium]
MTRLSWVRHGPTHAKTMVGWSDLPADLSDTAAIARLSAYLPQDALIVSSDLVRAVATADALQGPRQRLPHDPALRELNFGAWELRSHARIEAETPDHIRAFWDSPGDIAPPEGESWNNLAMRLHRATDALLATHPGRDIVIVAHFGPILAALQRAAGLHTEQAFAHRIEPLSVTETRFGPDGWRVGRINHQP